MEQGKIMEAEAPTVPKQTNGAPTTTTPKVFYRPDALPAAQPTNQSINQSIFKVA